MNDTFATRNGDQESLENLVDTQAVSVNLREAVMACLSGLESRRWTVLELVERFKNLGICASRASVTAALAELALEQAIQMANDTEFGLASYFYSRDIGRIWRAAEGLECGMG